MTVEDFFKFFTDIYADYDGFYGDQCFDLANAYSRWIGGQRFNGATADLIFNQPGDFYTQIPNTLDYVPIKGDLIVWNWPHVGIATGNNSDTNQFEVLEQNDPLNSNCHIKIYPNYNGVIGALRPKVLPTSANQPQPLAQLTLQTIIPKSLLDGEDADLEIQQIAGLLKDGKRDSVDLANTRAENDQLKQDLKACQDKPIFIPSTPPTAVFIPTTTLGKWLYSLTKLFG